MSRREQDAALLAAFLAKGKTAKQIAENTRTMTEREIYLANRGIKPDKSINNGKPIDQDDKPMRVHIVTDHCGREFYRNDKGEWL